MIKKIGVLLLGVVFIFNLFSIVSSLGVGVAICGNGILESGEQCDAGRSAFSFAPNYPAVVCSSMTCTCPAGTSPLIKSFEFGDTCTYITDCTEPVDNDSESCPREEQISCFDGSVNCVGGVRYLTSPFLAMGWADAPTECFWSRGESCPADSHFVIDADSHGYCQCDAGFFTSGTTCDLIPSNCTPGTAPCTYGLLGTVTSACCSAVEICDPAGSGCIPAPVSTFVTPRFRVTPLIKIGGGDEFRRDVTCSATIKPVVDGAYTFTISLEGSSTGSFTFTQAVVNDTSPCHLLTPSPFTIEHTFSAALSRDSPAIKCRLSYNTPTESNVSLSDSLHDIDKDRVDSTNQWDSSTLKPWTAYDVNDWVFNNTLYGDSTTDHKCVDDISADYDGVIVPEIINKSKECRIDNNNDGIGDFAQCSYCRNPRAAEDADDVDNNGWGFCQANVSRACRIEGDSYVGDGADNPGTPINVLNSAGAIVAKMGCGDVKNVYGVTDTFCQMVDNVPRMKEYQRAVKWGERTFTSTEFTVPPISSLLGGPVTYNQTISYEFIPGAVDSNSASCSLVETIRRVTPSYLGLDIGAFKELIRAQPAYSNGYTLQWASAPPGSGWATENVQALVKRTYYPDCMPSIESNGTHRNTVGTIFPQQFIDSFRGELDFSKFIPSYSVLHEKDSEGNFLWQWQTAFVNRDKCNDGANNAGPRDLLKTEPYGFFLDPIQKIVDINGVVTPLNPDFNVALIDVDNPECKFNSPQIVGGTNIVPKIYSASEHKTNPVTNKPYCLDNDGDGFCGAQMKWSSTTISGTAGSSSLPGSISSELEPMLDDKNYTLSKQFPDCDDGNYTGLYKIGTSDLLVSSALGWTTPFVGSSFTSWNVHPFAPVTKYTCTLGSMGGSGSYGYDFNCNKNMVDGGQDFGSLKSGKTPFDYDLGTGTENLAYGSDSPWYKQITLSTAVNRDAACYEYPAYKDFADTTTTSLGILTILGGFGAPALLGLQTSKAFALTMTVAGETVNGYQLISCLNDPTVSRASCYAMAGVSYVGYAIPMINSIRSSTPRSVKIFSGKSSSALSHVDAKARPIPRSEMAASDSAGLARGKVETPVPGCFLNNTMIYLADGSLKNIADVKLNDSVLAYDLINNKAVKASVTYTFERNETKYRIVKYEEIE